MNKIIWGLIIILLIVGSWLIFSDQQSEDVKDEADIAEQEKLNEEIALYPEGEWEEETSLLGVSALFPSSGDPISLEGKEWTLQISDLTDEGLRDIDFRQYYEDSLVSQGWSQEVEIGEIKYMPVMADGPYSSIWGYVKESEEGISAIILSQETTGEEISGPNEPILFGEPYVVDLKVFVSDPFFLEDTI